jgi:ElaB/YqjD/DUF883 family membrane-anchored ribosome-binding protein
MGAERDPGGEAGAGMSGPGYSAGDADRIGDVTGGGAEVRGGLHSHPADNFGASSGPRRDEYGALAYGTEADSQNLGQRAANRISGAADTVREQASTLGSRAGDLAGTARERAGDLAGQAREGVGSALTSAETWLENSGMLERVRQNPLPALGIAFGIGFVLAARSNNAIRSNPSINRAAGQLRGAVMAGVSAAVAREAKHFLDTLGQNTQAGRFVRQQVAGDDGGSFDDTSNLGGNARSGMQGGTGRSGYTAGNPSMGRTGTAGYRPPSHQENF